MLAVLRAGADAYGMAVRRELEHVTGQEVSFGAVYATLDRLEAKSLVESMRVQAETSRRVFSVTTRGARALVESRRMRERLWRGVDLGGLLPDSGL